MRALAERNRELEKELARLKDFQRATVDHVHRRLWTDAEPTRRFLVADEVGLGKTMTSQDILDGMMRVTVKVAVTHPAEFIVITVAQTMQTS